MILSDRDILREHDTHEAFISPFDPSQLRSSSYDLTLGNELHELATSAGVVYLDRQHDIDSLYVPRDISRGYILKPGQFVLCSIKETLALPDDIIAHILPRTRFTRLGIQVADQLCNASYTGRLQIGLTNRSPNNVSICEGLRVAQIVFEHLKSTPSEERLYRNQKDAGYQGEDEFRGAIFGGEELAGRPLEIFNTIMARLSGE